MADFTNSISTRDSRLCERYKSVDNSYTTTGTKSITITPTYALKSGFLRFRTKSVNAAATNTFNLKASDGSATVEILPTTTITAAGVASDVTVPFHLDISATSFTLTVVNTNNGNFTADFEVAGSR
jgi:hypothetical protein